MVLICLFYGKKQRMHLSLQSSRTALSHLMAAYEQFDCCFAFTLTVKDTVRIIYCALTTQHRISSRANPHSTGINHNNTRNANPSLQIFDQSVSPFLI